MKVHLMEQRTDEWYEVKTGRFSPSNFKKLMMGKTTKGYKEAVAKVIFGRMTGKLPEEFVSQDMQNGTDREPFARDAYRDQMSRDMILHEPGFVELDEWTGCSPDGLIEQGGKIVGGIEIKCPRWNTHIEYMDLAAGCCPKDYEWQIIGNMMICNVEWMDFVSFHFDLPMVIRRIHRKDIRLSEIKLKDRISEAKAEVISFLERNA